MATYTTFDDIYYYRDSIHYRDMLLYYRDSGKIWLSSSPNDNTPPSRTNHLDCQPTW